MTILELGALGEFVASLGVIASLLYLAVQVKGDREATRANTIQMRATAAREVALAVIESDHLAPILVEVGHRAFGDPAPRKVLVDQFGLSEEAALRLNSYWWMIMRQAEGTFQMPMSESEREQLVRGTASTLIVGPMEVWWEAAKAQGAATEFVAAIEQHRQHSVAT